MKNKTRIIIGLTSLGIAIASTTTIVILTEKKLEGFDKVKQKQRQEMIEIMKTLDTFEEGYSSAILQDHQNNLWYSGYKKPLQVLKWDKTRTTYDKKGWHGSRSHGLTKNSNIKEGGWTTLFQDHENNLWSISKGKPLQYLKWLGEQYDPNGWQSSITLPNSLTKNSNIKNGIKGIIFQDQQNNLWSVGGETDADIDGLQVLRWDKTKSKYDSQGWKSSKSEGLTKGSLLRSGYEDTITQDRQGNLWAMFPLQVLKWDKNNNQFDPNGWTTSKSDNFLKGSKWIKLRPNGQIFQDKQNNLWIISIEDLLQVLKWDATTNQYSTQGWQHSQTSGLTKGSKIVNGSGGIIFQDKQNNLWSAGGLGTPLQVLEWDATKNQYSTEGWKHSKTSGLTKNMNLKHGSSPQIIQDSQNNLWLISLLTKLHSLKWIKEKNAYDSQGWKEWKNNNSNVTKGQSGFIFEDVKGNIWTAALKSKLQVLIKGSNEWINKY